MRMLMTVTMGIAMVVTVSMRMIVAVVFCRQRQYVSFSGVTVNSWALTMYKCRAYDVKTQADAAYDHDKSRILDACGAGRQSRVVLQ